MARLQYSKRKYTIFIVPEDHESNMIHTHKMAKYKTMGVLAVKRKAMSLPSEVRGGRCGEWKARRDKFSGQAQHSQVSIIHAIH